MILRGIELVNARQFQYETLFDAKEGCWVLSAKCIGSACWLTASIKYKQESELEAMLLSIKIAMADKLDPLYEEVEIYDDEATDDEILVAVQSYIDIYGFIEADNWQIEKHKDIYKITCCSKHPEKIYNNLKDALDSLSVLPDNYYTIPVSWKDRLK